MYELLIQYVIILGGHYCAFGSQQHQPINEHEAQPVRLKVFEFTQERKNLMAAEKNHTVHIQDNQHKTLLTEALSLESNQGHIGERPVLHTQSTQPNKNIHIIPNRRVTKLKTPPKKKNK